MTDIYPPGAPGQHDTTALPRPYPPPAQGPGYGPGYGPGPGSGPELGYQAGNPAADAWEARYLLQRTRTRVAIGVAAVTSALALALGVAAWQFSQANPLMSAASDLASGLSNGDLNLDGLVPPAAPSDGSAPSSPDGSAPTTPDGSTALPDVPLSELPLPDSLKSIAGNLGITDVGQLLDLVVANGLISEGTADDLRSAIAAGAAVQGFSQ